MAGDARCRRDPEHRGRRSVPGPPGGARAGRRLSDHPSTGAAGEQAGRQSRRGGSRAGVPAARWLIGELFRGRSRGDGAVFGCRPRRRGRSVAAGSPVLARSLPARDASASRKLNRNVDIKPDQHCAGEHHHESGTEVARGGGSRGHLPRLYIPGLDSGTVASRQGGSDHAHPMPRGPGRRWLLGAVGCGLTWSAAWSAPDAPPA